ncbi:MAG: putative ABC transporter ATP-binding protein YknY [Myxococcota bacterium]|nr:putative ABC transporter ATP-binding protein YknY [Myxococcota bacterium]
MSAPIVQLSNVVKEYPLGHVTVTALDGVSLDIDAGDFITIAGPSGSGKTTILNMIGCVDVPTRGEVVVDGQPTRTLSDRALTSLRLHKLGFIFQSFNLIPVLSVAQNVEFPLLLQGHIGAAERKKRVAEMVEKVGLTPQSGQRPSELSGGQRQRVAIARALVTRPRIVMADEPTANLDSVTGQNIIELMRHLNETEQTTFIFSTHDPKVMAHAKRIVRIKDGKVEDDGRGNASNNQAAA